MDGEGRFARSLKQRLARIVAPWLPTRSDAAIVAVQSAKAIAVQQ